MAAVEEKEVVRQAKHEPKCKLCKTQFRGEIDNLLFIRSRRGKQDGTLVTFDYVKAFAEEKGVENVTQDNVTVHWAKHCEVVLESDEEEISEAVMSVLGDLTPEQIKEMTAADRLELLELQGFVELQAKLKRTGKTGITLDQVIRINELKQRQKSNEDQRRFLGALGSGIGAALGAALRPALPAAEHPVIEIEESEVVRLGEETNVSGPEE